MQPDAKNGEVECAGIPFARLYIFNGSSMSTFLLWTPQRISRNKACAVTQRVTSGAREAMIKSVRDEHSVRALDTPRKRGTRDDRDERKMFRTIAFGLDQRFPK